MSQSCLDKWFDIKPTIKKVPKIFYLDWSENRPYPTNQAIFYEDKLPDNLKYNYEFKINWKEYKTLLHVYGKLNKYSEPYNFNIVDKPLIINEIFLASQLQKAVRRKENNIAVQTANDLIKLDIKKFIRRLPIIMLEDTILHKSFTTIIWILINLDNEIFKITKNMIKWLLGIVDLITNLDNKYIINKEIDEINILNYREDILKIKEDYYSNLYAILLRKSYGGMKGDCKFLFNCFRFYLNKMKDNNLIEDFYKKNKGIELTISNIKSDEYLDYAYDFHVNPKIIDYLCKNFPEFDNFHIQKLIWEYSSSINYRGIINKEEKKDENKTENKTEIKDWNIIKKKYIWITKQNIKNLIERKSN